VLTAQLKEIDREKEDFLKASQSGEHARMAQLIELICAVDGQGSENQNEIQEFQADSASKEAQYRAELTTLTSEITKTHEKQRTAAQQRRGRIAALQSEIDVIESEFSGKMANAARIGEKLRVALGMVKQRKQEVLQAEKQRSTDRSKLLRENSALRRKIFALETQIVRARGSASGLRREVSATVGARLTASLFL
jgi:DNA repair exonuclease SbcCD ATPase subunit